MDSNNQLDINSKLSYYLGHIHETYTCRFTCKFPLMMHFEHHHMNKKKSPCTCLQYNPFNNYPWAAFYHFQSIKKPERRLKFLETTELWSCVTELYKKSSSDSRHLQKFGCYNVCSDILTLMTTFIHSFSHMTVQLGLRLRTFTNG